MSAGWRNWYCTGNHNQQQAKNKMGTQEIVLIGIAVLLLFGGKKIPELMRGLGKGMREFKDASSGVRREIEDTVNEVERAAKTDPPKKPRELAAAKPDAPAGTKETTPAGAVSAASEPAPKTQP